MMPSGSLNSDGSYAMKGIVLTYFHSWELPGPTPTEVSFTRAYERVAEANGIKKDLV